MRSDARPSACRTLPTPRMRVHRCTPRQRSGGRPARQARHHLIEFVQTMTISAKCCGSVAMTAFHSLLVSGFLLMLSIMLTPLSNRIGMPVLLIFFAVGMAAGEDGPGGIQFHDFNTAFLVGNL